MVDKKKEDDSTSKIAPDRLDRFAWDDSNVGDLEWEDAPTKPETPPKTKKEK